MKWYWSGIDSRHKRYSILMLGMETYNKLLTILDAKQCLGETEEWSQLYILTWQTMCPHRWMIGGRHIASRKIESRRCWDGMMVGVRDGIRAGSVCQNDGSEQARSISVAPRAWKHLDDNQHEILRSGRDDGQTMAYHQPTFDGWWCRKYMVMTIRGETPARDGWWWTSSRWGRDDDGMRLARRMPTQYKMCGVYHVIGWVELLIEEGRPRMTERDGWCTEMEETAEWSRRWWHDGQCIRYADFNNMMLADSEVAYCNRVYNRIWDPSAKQLMMAVILTPK